MQAKIFDITYEESCFECDSIHLDIRNITQSSDDQNIVTFEVVCRDCGETWNDWEEIV